VAWFCYAPLADFYFGVDKNAMSFSLPELPYAHDALAPYMSRETPATLASCETMYGS
jgi:hypothetical protein